MRRANSGAIKVLFWLNRSSEARLDSFIGSISKFKFNSQ